MLRKETDKGTIHVVLEDRTASKTHYEITTTITPSSSGEDELKQSVPKGFPREQLFVSAYGAGRTAIGSDAHEKYRAIDALWSLFNYDADLQNPEIPLARLGLQKVDTAELIRRVTEGRLLTSYGIS